jgi:ADP-ribose pyrophosphatase YjhB (NUDIX family)
VADLVGASDRWIPDELYQQIQRSVPIVCVDLLPLSADLTSIGLILRDTYDGNQGLCLVGGAILFDEHIQEALARHLRATLGASVELDAESLRFESVYQYFVTPRTNELHDPRKHAVALVYSGVVHGQAAPAGEAHSFQYYRLDALPRADAFGFGQDQVVHDILKRDLRADRSRQ